MTERSKFQFRMRDLLWAVTLFAFMLWAGMALWRSKDEVFPLVPPILMFLLAFALIALCGAGVGAVFRAPIVGAAAALAIAGIVLFALCGVGLVALYR